MTGLETVKKESEQTKSACCQGARRCATFCEVKKCCKKYKNGKRCKSCPKK